jgi:hypothetical protein
MNLGFTLNDALHTIAVKFVPAYLPTAEKAFNLRARFQQELDIHELALKAAVYNINTSPAVIEEGLKKGIELMYYLTADGYRIKTDLFTLSLRLPGQYKGQEERLAEGVHAVPKLRASASFRKYLRDKVKLEFMGVDAQEGIIAEAKDEATGRVDEIMTRGNVLTISGKGLKIVGEAERMDQMGVFFLPDTGAPIKASVIVVNTQKTLKVLIPTELMVGKSYKLAVETQGSSRGAGVLVKKERDLRSAFKLVAA